MSLGKKVTIRMIFGLLLSITLLFFPAGTIFWAEGWIFIAFYLLFGIFAFKWLLVNSPQLLEKRMAFQRPKKIWDLFILIGVFLGFLALYIIAGLDAVRYRWSDVPLSLEVVGFIGLAVSFYVIFLTMKENPFLSKIVEIQQKDGHRVITTGPYRYVRHPMYSGCVIMLFSFSLALGSWCALIPSAGLTLLLSVRTHLEDLTLHEELPGYTDYSKKTRFKLLPGVW